MEDRCYFCRRTINECREYIESLRQDFLKEAPDRFWTPEEKNDSKNQFDRFTKYGMSRIDFGAVCTSRGVVHGLHVPACPICKGCLDTAVNNLECTIENLKNGFNQ